MSAFLLPALPSALRSSFTPGNLTTHITPFLTPFLAPLQHTPLRHLATMTTTAQSTSSTPSITRTSEPFKLPDPFPIPPPLKSLHHSMFFEPTPPLRTLAKRWRLAKQVFGRIQGNTTLFLHLSGALSESPPPAPPFSKPPLALETVLKALRLAAHDPRIVHVHLRIDPLTCGWAKVFEIRRHLEYFSQSGKGVTIYIETAGPKEYLIAMGFALYVPPEGGLALRGFLNGVGFVGGVLEKVGVKPQVERIGKYKSAGDQLSRKDMSNEHREVVQGLLAEVNREWCESVVQATGVEQEVLKNFVDRCPWDMEEYKKVGLVKGVCYETDVLDALKIKYRGWTPKKEALKRKLKMIEGPKYVRRVSEKLLGLAGRQSIAVVKVVGGITGGKSGSSPVSGGTVGSDTFVELIRKVRESKKYKGCVIRVDSGGGSALASDIMWREVRKLSKVMPVVASMGDVAASGGYYVSMGCSGVVAESLTLTGSVGVVAAKPSLGEFYDKIGFVRENISVGSRFAEVLVDDRAFTEEEAQYFKDFVQLSYTKFVKRAALSRGKSSEDMDEVAQGRVWSGKQALDRGLVDYLGGMGKAIEVVKEKAKLEDDYIKIVEVKKSLSFLERFGLGGASTADDVARAVQGPLAIADVDQNGLTLLNRFIADSALAPLEGLVQYKEHVVETLIKTMVGVLSK